MAQSVSGEGRCDIPVSEMGPGVVERYNRYLSGRGVVRNTVSFYNRVLRAIYNKAVLEYRLPDLRPFAGVYTEVDRTVLSISLWRYLSLFTYSLIIFGIYCKYTINSERQPCAAQQ